MELAWPLPRAILIQGGSMKSVKLNLSPGAQSSKNTWESSRTQLVGSCSYEPSPHRLSRQKEGILPPGLPVWASNSCYYFRLAQPFVS